ncbi:DUF397 domain-containing protein [Streptomyces sp. NPDC050418]|uniref:DUF397 domain-containing protein n=1 Tax=Streptomyces sp. NPDC050418 TaxID=3365612 RepID=UPI00379E4847
MTSNLQWFKSSYSSDSGGECVEVAFAHLATARNETVHVRDSKTPTHPHLTLTAPTWTTFLDWAK